MHPSLIENLEPSMWHTHRSEETIRDYFASDGHIKPTTTPKSDNAADMPRIPSIDSETFDRWFPGLLRSQTTCQSPSLRILCFPNAGNAEDMYTSEGTYEYWKKQNMPKIIQQYLDDGKQRWDEFAMVPAPWAQRSFTQYFSVYQYIPF